MITVSLATVPNNPRGATICYGTYSQNTSRSRNNTIKGQRDETTPSGRRPLYAGGVPIRTWEASLYAGLEIRQADKTVNSLEAPALAYATLDSPIYIHQPRRYVGTTASVQPRRAIQSIYVYRTTHNV